MRIRVHSLHSESGLTATPPDVRDRLFKFPLHVVLEGDLILAWKRALQPISTAKFKRRQSAAVAQVVERSGEGPGQIRRALLKNVNLYSSGGTGEQLGQRGVSILE